MTDTQSPRRASILNRLKRLPSNWRRAAATLTSSLVIVVVAGYVLFESIASDASPIQPQNTNSSTLTGLTTTDLTNDNQLLIQSGLAMEDNAKSSLGGWTYDSQIQGQNRQTDRDVGAASVGMGFIALGDHFPANARWINDAKRVATWLMAVSHQDSNGGIWWNDYVNGSQESSSVYTSFDDGPLGIGDFFWQLYQRTGDPQYKTYALGSVTWLFSQAQTVQLSPDGQRVAAAETGYRWVWDTSTISNPLNSQDPPIYSSGMGMGIVGIINELATYYQRTHISDPAFAAECQTYMQGALNYLDSVRDTLGSPNQGGNSNALPETEVVGQNGDTEEDSGYLSGAAGAAYMYLNLYQIFNNPAYLNEAKGLLSWLTSSSGPEASVSIGIAWHIAIDPQDSHDRENAKIATGFEEGNAGIGWTFLQAYNVTGDEQYLNVAKQAANWLLSPSVAISDGRGGYSWPEDYNPQSKYTHSSLDNGAAGIGMFLDDVYRASHDSTYLSGAQKAATWLNNTALHKQYKGATIAYWKDNDDGQGVYTGDMSYHWGNAGIVADLTRLTTPTLSKTLDIPGEEPALAQTAPGLN